MELLPNDLIAIINRYLLCDRHDKVVREYCDKWLNLNLDDDDLNGSMRHEIRWDDKMSCFATYYGYRANYRNVHPTTGGIYNTEVLRFGYRRDGDGVVWLPGNY